MEKLFWHRDSTPRAGPPPGSLRGVFAPLCPPLCTPLRGGRYNDGQMIHNLNWDSLTLGQLNRPVWMIGRGGMDWILAWVKGLLTLPPPPSSGKICLTLSSIFPVVVWTNILTLFRMGICIMLLWIFRWNLWYLWGRGILTPPPTHTQTDEIGWIWRSQDKVNAK